MTSLKEQTQGQPGRQYYAAIDYAEKRDLTVGVVLHKEAVGEDSFRLVVDRMDVVVPRPDSPTPVAWVGDWIERISAKFQRVEFILDEWQLLGVIQAWEREGQNPAVRVRRRERQPRIGFDAASVDSAEASRVVSRLRPAIGYAAAG